MPNTVATSPLATSTAAGTKKSALVVGGGLAGIAAALALARQGVDVQLLEARRRLGGRVGSFTEPATGQTVDYCQHVAMGCCHNFRKLICWLDQESCWDVHRELHFYGPQGNYQRLTALPYVPAPWHLAGWLWKWPGLSLRDRVSVARGMLAVRRLPITTATDRQVAHDWLVQNSQTNHAIEHFWHTIIVSALGEELGTVSLSAMLKVLQSGFMNHRDAFHLLIPNRSLGTLFSSSTEDRLRAANVDVQLQTPVQQLVMNGSDKHALAVGAQIRKADAIVMAVPWFRWKDLQPAADTTIEQLVNQTAQIKSSPITGIHSWWDRPWLKTPHASIVGRMCQWVFPQPAHERSEMDSGQPAETYYQIVISASRELPRGDPAAIQRMVHEDLMQVFPEVRSAKLKRLQVVTDPQAVFSLSPECTRLRPSARVGNSNLWLAGDWVRTGWPATMEGAVISGWQAAESILESWGQPAAIVEPS